MTITSAYNDRVKELVRLRERRHRDRTGRFVVEGVREVRRAIDADVVIEALYVCPDLVGGTEAIEVIERARARDIEIVELADVPFRKAAYRTTPEGLLAVAAQFPTDPGLLTLPVGALVLVAEAIEKPGNLGTMLRTADAVGADAVAAADPTTDPFNPNVVRASTGALFTVPLAVGTSSQIIERLRRDRIRIVATSPDAARSLWDIDLTPAVAVVVGTERNGLTQAWLDAADVTIRIPMAGHADSLNTAMAAGVVLFEAVRQRTAAG